MTTAYTTIRPQTGIFDPAATFGLRCINDLFGGAQGRRNLELLQHYGSTVSSGMIEYVRRLSLINQPIHSLLTRTLGLFNSSITTTSNEGKFTVSIPLGTDVKPDDVKVTVRDREIIVEVKMQDSTEDGTARLAQEYYKKIILPEEVKNNQVKSILTPEGVLKIEAPLAPERFQVVEIPVNVDSDELTE